MSNCYVCYKPLDFEPQTCCSGRDCGCLGLPIEPPVCSDECFKKYMLKLTTNEMIDDNHETEIEKLTKELAEARELLKAVDHRLSKSKDIRIKNLSRNMIGTYFDRVNTK